VLRVREGCEQIARYAGACLSLADDVVRTLIRYDTPLAVEELTRDLDVPPAAMIDVLHSDYRFAQDAEDHFHLRAQDKLRAAANAGVVTLLHTCLYWRGLPTDIGDLTLEASYWQKPRRTRQDLKRIMFRRQDFVECGDSWLLRCWLGESAQFEPGYMLVERMEDRSGPSREPTDLAGAIRSVLREVEAPVPFELLYWSLRFAPSLWGGLSQSRLLKATMACGDVVFLRNGHFALEGWLEVVKEEYCGLRGPERRRRREQLLERTLAYHAEGDQYARLLSSLRHEAKETALHHLGQHAEETPSYSNLRDDMSIASRLRRELGVLRLPQDDENALLGRIESEVEAGLRVALRQEGVLFLPDDRVAMLAPDRVRELADGLCADITGIEDGRLCRHLWPQEASPQIDHRVLAEHLEEFDIEYTDGYWHVSRERLRGLVSETIADVQDWLCERREPAEIEAVVRRALPVEDTCPPPVYRVVEEALEDVYRSASGLWALACGAWWALPEELATTERLHQLLAANVPHDDDSLERALDEIIGFQLSRLSREECSRLVAAFQDAMPPELLAEPTVEEGDFSAREEQVGDLGLVSEPPRTSRITLTEEMMRSRSLRLAAGARRILNEYCGDLESRRRVVVAVEGQYHVTCWVLSQGRRLVSEQLFEWLSQREAAPGDHVVFYSPISPERIPHLALETAVPTQASRVGGRGEALQLRARVATQFRQRERAMHLDDIVEALTDELGEQVAKSSIASTLSSNPHLFAVWGSAVWGLREWAEDWTDYVDLQLLAWRVDEEDLIFRILREAGRPLSSRQIAGEIAQHFDVRVQRVREITLPLREDPRLSYDEETGLVSLASWRREPCVLLLHCAGFLRDHATERRQMSRWFASRWDSCLEDKLSEHGANLTWEGDTR